MDDKNKEATFNSQNEREQMEKQNQQERSQTPDAYAGANNALSTGNSVCLGLSQKLIQLRGVIQHRKLFFQISI